MGTSWKSKLVSLLETQMQRKLVCERDVVDFEARACNLKHAESVSVAIVTNHLATSIMAGE